MKPTRKLCCEKGSAASSQCGGHLLTIGTWCTSVGGELMAVCHEKDLHGEVRIYYTYSKNDSTIYSVHGTGLELRYWRHLKRPWTDWPSNLKPISSPNLRHDELRCGGHEACCPGCGGTANFNSWSRSRQSSSFTSVSLASPSRGA